MPQRIEFNGQVHEFPDEFSQEQISRALKSFAPNAPPPAQPAPEPFAPGDAGSWLEQAGQKARFGAQGFNQGLAQTVELPYDAVNHLPGLLDVLNPFSFDKDVAQARGDEPAAPTISELVDGVPVLEQLFPSRDPIMGIGDNLGLTNVVEPVSKWDRVIERGGEEFGASVVPMLGSLKRAGTLSREGTRAQDMGLFDRAFNAPFKDAPVKTAIAESASAIGAGAGAESASDYGPWEETIGGIAGGIVAPFGAAGPRAVWEGLKSAAFDESFARNEVGRLLVDEASDPRVLERPQLRELVDQSGGAELNPTLGQATNDSGLKSLEYGRLTGPNKGRYSERRSAQSQALRNGIEDTAPLDATDDSFLDTLDTLDADRTARFTDEQRQAIEDAAMWHSEGQISADEAQAMIDDALNTLPADPAIARETASNQAANRVFGDAEDSVLSRERARRNELYDAVPDDVEVPTAASREAAIAELDQLGRAGNAQPSIARIAEDEAETIPLGRARKDLTTLGDDAQASRRAGRPGDARVLDNVRQGVRQDLESAGEANDALRIANQNDSENYAPRFREGVPADVRAGKVTNDKYLGKALKDPVEADRLAMTIEGDEAAQTAVRDWLIADLGSGGAENMTPARADKWLRDNGAVLERFPEVRDEAQRLRNQLASGGQERARAQGVIQGARKLSDDALKMKPDDPDKSAELYRAGEDREGRILKVMNAPKSRERLTELADMASSKEDLDGLKRGFVELMMKGTKGKNGIVGSDGQINPGAAKNFLRDYGDHVDILYRDSPQHAQDIRRMLKSVEIIDRVGSSRARGTTGTGASGSSGSPSGRLEVGGVPMTSLMSRIFAAESGRTSYRFVVSESLGQVFARARAKFGGKTFEKVLDQAMLDPEFAAMLAANYNKDLDRKATKTFAAILLREGARAGREARLSYGEDDEADEPLRVEVRPNPE